MKKCIQHVPVNANSLVNYTKIECFVNRENAAHVATEADCRDVQNVFVIMHDTIWLSLIVDGS